MSNKEPTFAATTAPLVVVFIVLGILAVLLVEDVVAAGGAARGESAAGGATRDGGAGAGGETRRGAGVEIWGTRALGAGRRDHAWGAGRDGGSWGIRRGCGHLLKTHKYRYEYGTNATYVVVDDHGICRPKAGLIEDWTRLEGNEG